ncbi:putative proteasome-associated protein ECM29 [Paratrimastix pyriformis]|uniref:Proteasome-associated protein ECM29 n=1 Tax=Paratrimastix pyriformis TaxID=342808 RepID=A0ABQ8UJV9_9EUKA|nr:putative proteasome-associated protein ECM29 [Paratrimastix pyriformis]
MDATLDKILNDVAHTDDSGLDVVLQAHLIPLLNCAGSDNQDIRSRAIELLSHITKRVRPNPDIRLPAQALIELFLTSPSFVVKNLTMIFADMAFARLAPLEKSALFRLVVLALGPTTGTTAAQDLQQGALLRMAVRALPQLSIPSTFAEARAAFSYFFTEQPRSETSHTFDHPLMKDQVLTLSSNLIALLDFSLDLLLCNPPDQKDSPCSTLPSDLVAIQTFVLKFLGSTLFRPFPNLVLKHALAASCSFESSVRTLGETLLKEVRPNADLEAPDLVASLYRLALGSASPVSPDGPATIVDGPDSKKRAPFSIQVAVMKILSRSVRAANTVPAAVTLLRTALLGPPLPKATPQQPPSPSPALPLPEPPVAPGPKTESFMKALGLAPQTTADSPKPVDSGPPLTTPSLQVAAVSFAQWVLLQASEDSLRAMAPALYVTALTLTSVYRPAQTEGQKSNPAQQQLEQRLRIHGTAPHHSAMRDFGYQCLGSLARRLPAVVRNSNGVALVAHCLEALRSEDASFRLALVEALSMLSGAFAHTVSPPLPPQIEDRLSQLMAEALQHPRSTPQARFAAVSWALRTRPFHDLTARLVCIIGAADPDQSVRDEARKGLNPPGVPFFMDPADAESPSASAAPATLEACPDFSEALKYLLPGAFSLTIPCQALGFLVHFLRVCLHTGSSEEYAARAGRLASDPAALGAYLGLLARALDPLQGVDSASRAALCENMAPLHFGVMEGAFALLEILVHLPPSGIPLPSVESLCGALFSKIAPQPARLALSKAIGIIALRTPNPSETLTRLAGEMSAFLSSAPKISAVDQLQSRILALGALCAQGVSAHCLPEPVFRQALGSLFDVLSVSGQHPTLLIGACRSLALVAGLGPLPISQSGSEGMSKEALFTTVLPPLLKHADLSVAQGALEVVGALCGGEATAWMGAKALATLTTHLSQSVKDDLIQLAVGETLAQMLTVAGPGIRLFCTLPSPQDMLFQEAADHDPLLPLLRDMAHPADRSHAQEVTFAEKWATDNAILRAPVAAGSPAASRPPVHQMRGFAKALLHAVLQQCTSERSSRGQRRSGVVWLLGIIHHAGCHPAVRERLSDVQEVFLGLISMADEYVQEICAKGMGAVYRAATEEDRKLLVRLVIEAFTDPQRISVEKTALMSDPEMMHVNRLQQGPADSRNAPDSPTQRIITYRELAGMAQELGYPPMVYCFFDMTESQPMWESPRGTRYHSRGLLRELTERSPEQLEAVILPKLYRFRFDPNDRIRDSMNALWRILVPNTNSLISRHFDRLVGELAASAHNPNWRVAQAALLGGVDLLARLTASGPGALGAAIPATANSTIDLLTRQHAFSRLLHEALLLIVDPPPSAFQHPSLAQAGWQLLDQLGMTMFVLVDWHQHDEGAQLRAAAQRAQAGGPGRGGDFALGLGAGDPTRHQSLSDQLLGTRQVGISVTRSEAQQAVEVFIPVLLSIFDFCQDPDTTTPLEHLFEGLMSPQENEQTRALAEEVLQGLPRTGLDAPVSLPSGLSAVMGAAAPRLSAHLQQWSLTALNRILNLAGSELLRPAHLTVRIVGALLTGIEARDHARAELEEAGGKATVQSLLNSLMGNTAPPGASAAVQRVLSQLTHANEDSPGAANTMSPEDSLNICLQALQSAGDLAASQAMGTLLVAVFRLVEQGGPPGAGKGWVINHGCRCAWTVHRWAELSGRTDAFKVQAPRLLRALLPLGTHPSRPIIAAVADAIAVLIPTLPSGVVARDLIEPATARFFTFDLDTMSAATLLLTSLMRHSAALVEDVRPLLMPLAFFGWSCCLVKRNAPPPRYRATRPSATSQDQEDEPLPAPRAAPSQEEAEAHRVREQWNTLRDSWREAWDSQIMSSTGTAIHLYLRDILRLVRRALVETDSAQSLAAKRCGSHVLHKACRLLHHEEQNPRPRSAPPAPGVTPHVMLSTLEQEMRLLPALLALIKGRPFTGKEDVIKACVSLSLALGLPATGDSSAGIPAAAEVGELLVGECTRGTVDSRIASLEQAGRFLECYSGAPVFEKAFSVILNFFGLAPTGGLASLRDLRHLWNVRAGVPLGALPTALLRALFKLLHVSWPDYRVSAPSQIPWVGASFGLCWSLLRDLPAPERGPCLECIDRMLSSTDPATRLLACGAKPQEQTVESAAAGSLTLENTVLMLSENLGSRNYEVNLGSVRLLFSMTTIVQTNFPHADSLRRRVATLLDDFQGDPELRLHFGNLAEALKRM